MTRMAYLARGRDAERVELGRLLGEGAAGRVHAVTGRPGVAAKLYHDSASARANEAKIDAMLARPPQLPPAAHEGVGYPQIAWPQAKLYDANGEFAGFLMPEIDFSRSTSLVNLLQKSSRRAEGISDYYGYRVLVARNLASVFAELHGAGHFMIDMKPANLRFYPFVSWMAVIDADGFSIAGNRRRIPAEQVSDEYIAPESWQRKPAELGEAQDRFALAVIIFQLLNNGLHPFAGAAKGAGQATDIQGRIVEGLYSYAMTPHPDVAPGSASLHRSFRRSTRKLFDRAFLPGEERPDAATWRDHLDGLLGMLVPCEAKPLEHAHFGTGCGFCSHEARMLSAAIAQAKKADRRPRGVPLGAPAAATATVPRRAAPPPVQPARPAPRRRGRGGAGPGFVRVALPVATICAVLASAATLPWTELAEADPVATQLAASIENDVNDGPVRIAIPRTTTTSSSDYAALAPVSTTSQERSRATEQRAEAAVPTRSEQVMADAGSPGLGDVRTVIAAGAGFDCARRTDWLDRHLCEQPQLAAAHQNVSDRYDALLAHSDPEARGLLASGQQRWIAAHRRCILAVRPTNCLSQSYNGRLTDLAALEKGA